MILNPERSAAVVAGVLFITATAATIAAQTLLSPILETSDALDAVMARSMRLRFATLFEMINALASAGIAIALYPILRRHASGGAIGYVSIRAIEGCLGMIAAVNLISLTTLEPASAPAASSVALLMNAHHWMFLAVLIVFSLSTLILYPTLYRFRIVPSWLSLWGLIGGLLLIVSLGLVLFGVIEVHSTVDTALSIPIAINEMALALWLIIRGVNRSEAKNTTTEAAP